MLELDSDDDSLFEDFSDDDDDDLLEYLLFQKVKAYHKNLFVNQKFFDHLPKILNKHLTIDSLEDWEIPSLFRFRSKSQLYRLLNGFRFRDFYHASNRYRFSGEEILLAGLFRLSHITTLGDLSWRNLFGWSQAKCSCAFPIFLNHTCQFKYLLTIAFQFWKNHILDFQDAIRLKLRSYNLDFNSLRDGPDGFEVFSFIDNSKVKTCRPGSGSAKDRPGSPRNDN